MGWLGKPNYNKTLQKIKEREALELKQEEETDLPIMGRMATEEDRQVYEIDKKEDKQAEELEAINKEEEKKEKASQDLLVVIDGAQIECKLCTSPQGVLKVNLDTPSTQDKKTATVVEKDATSLIFFRKLHQKPQ